MIKKLLIATLTTLMTASAVAGWKVQKQEDTFDGTSETFIIGERVQPNAPMSFPYANPLVYLYLQCSNGLFIMRNTANNFIDIDYPTHSYAGDYVYVNMRVKVDGKLLRYSKRGRQDFGSEFIVLPEDADILSAKKEIVIQVNHFGDGLRHYTFDLTGLDRSQCND